MKSKIALIVLAVVLVVSVVFIGCAKPAVGPAGGGGYPERPITVLIGYGAGGGTDMAARAIGAPLSQTLGQSLACVNLPGGAGSICEDYLLKQPADGYTVLCTSGDLPINLVTGRNANSIDDYIPFARVQMDTGNIQINAKDSRFSNIDEFVAYAKKNRVTIGGTGAGGLDEIVVAMFVKASGIQADYVTYEKAGKLRAAVVAGDIDACHEEIGPAVGLIESGDLKPILIFNDERVEGFPDLPCVVEKGWGDITVGRCRGFMFKAGTPEPIIDYLEDAVHKAYLTDGYRTWEREQYLHLRPGWADRATYTQQTKDQMVMYREVLTDLGYL